MKNYYLDYLIERNADGIDFIPISEAFYKKDELHYNIIKSYTKEQLMTVESVPKTCYLCWKVIDGKKIYVYD